MTTLFRNRHPRAFAALFIAAVSVALFGLLFLQLYVPIILGPAGLFLIVALDLTLYLGVRRRLRHPRPRRRSLITFGPVDKRYRARRRDALEADLMATYALIVFLIAVYVVGLALRVEFLAIDPNLDLYLVGSVMTFLATVFLAPWWGQFAPWGYWAKASMSELADTTEDH